MRQGRAKYVYPGSNTPSGFKSFYYQGMKDLEQVFILKGGPGCGKSTLMRKIGLAMLERGYDVEFWQCSSDNDSLDGVLIPALSVGVIDGTPPHNIDPRYPGAVEEIVDLGQHWQASELRKSKREIVDLSERISGRFTACYALLADLGEQLQDAQDARQEALDADKLERKLGELEEAVFRPAAGRARHLFSSAITPRGLISFADAISRRASRRYLLIGPPGGGKEALLSRMAALSERYGHRAELYHSALLPDNIELLYLPDLALALLDCGETAPEALPGDSIIVCDEELLREGAKCAPAAAPRTAEIVELAAACLSEAKGLHDQLEAYYRKAMDFSAVDNTANRLFNRILALTAEPEA